MHVLGPEQDGLRDSELGQQVPRDAARRHEEFSGLLAYRVQVDRDLNRRRFAERVAAGRRPSSGGADRRVGTQPLLF